MKSLYSLERPFNQVRQRFQRAGALASANLDLAGLLLQ